MSNDSDNYRRCETRRASRRWYYRISRQQLAAMAGIDGGRRASRSSPLCQARQTVATGEHTARTANAIFGALQENIKLKTCPNKIDTTLEAPKSGVARGCRQVHIGVREFVASRRSQYCINVEGSTHRYRMSGHAWGTHQDAYRRRLSMFKRHLVCIHCKIRTHQSLLLRSACVAIPTASSTFCCT